MQRITEIDDALTSQHRSGTDFGDHLPHWGAEVVLSLVMIGFGNDAHAARAYRALGATAYRVEILRAVLHNGDTSAGWLMMQFDLTRNGVLYHLNALTAEGLLSTRHGTHPRGAGPITYWFANRDEVRLFFDDFVSHLLNDY